MKEDWPVAFSSSFVSTYSPLAFPLPNLSCASSVLLRIHLFRDGWCNQRRGRWRWRRDAAGRTDTPLVSSYLHLFWSFFFFFSLRCWLRYPGLLLRVPCVCVRPVSTEKRRLLLLWLVRGHGAQWWLLVLVGPPGAVQRGWFAGDVASAGWAIDAGEGTHGFRCTASGAGGGAPCWLLMRAHGAWRWLSCY